MRPPPRRAMAPRLRTGRSALFGGWDAHRAAGGRPDPYEGAGGGAFGCPARAARPTHSTTPVGTIES